MIQYAWEETDDENEIFVVTVCGKDKARAVEVLKAAGARILLVV